MHFAGMRIKCHILKFKLPYLTNGIVFCSVLFQGCNDLFCIGVFESLPIGVFPQVMGWVSLCTYGGHVPRSRLLTSVSVVFLSVFPAETMFFKE